MQDEMFLDGEGQRGGDSFGCGVSFAEQDFSEEQGDDAENEQISEDGLVGNGIDFVFGVRHFLNVSLIGVRLGLLWKIQQDI